MNKKMKQENLFHKRDSVLPCLYRDMILAEYIRPILFTCLDEYNHLYICSCYHADGDAVKWILAKTTEEAVIRLLQNEIPIRDMFSGAEKIYLLTLSERGAQPQAEEKATEDVPENYFPTAGYDMEADEGEFDEEIAELRERIAERASDPYELLSSGRTTSLFSFYSLPKQNFPDIVEMKRIVTNALESYSYRSPSGVQWQTDGYYRERQLFHLFFFRTQVNISGFKKNPQTEELFLRQFDFQAPIQVPARSLSTH